MGVLLVDLLQPPKHGRCRVAKAPLPRPDKVRTKYAIDCGVLQFIMILSRIVGFSAYTRSR